MFAIELISQFCCCYFHVDPKPVIPRPVSSRSCKVVSLSACADRCCRSARNALRAYETFGPVINDGKSEIVKVL